MSLIRNLIRNEFDKKLKLRISKYTLKYKIVINKTTKLRYNASFVYAKAWVIDLIKVIKGHQSRLKLCK